MGYHRKTCWTLYNFFWSKFIETRGRKLKVRDRAALELLYTHFADQYTNREDHRFAGLSFTDDYSSAVFVYFFRTKSDTVQETEKFPADTAPYGKVKCIGSDNGTEFMCRNFQTLLRKNGIKHETSAPYLPHQNGTAERGWRTLFEMGRCMLTES